MRNPSVSPSSVVAVTFLFLLLCENLTNGEVTESMIQLPRYKGFRNRVNSKRVVSITDFGAKGDGLNDDTEALINAWEVACSLPSRSRIEIQIPAGNTYWIRPVNFPGPCSSKITLRVSGTILAPDNPDVWDGLNPRKWLYFHGLKHFTIEGGGVINGMGKEWWSRSCKVNTTNPCRHAPNAITFHKCKHLNVRNIVMLNSQQMHMAFTNCIHVKASHLKVIAPVDSPNTDAIHISSSYKVEIRDIVINTGDDCVSIVGNSSNIRIRDISCTAGHGISIGSLGKSNSWSQVRHVSVDRVFLSNTENGVRIKTWQGGSGFVEKIGFRNVVVKNVSNPIIIDQFYCDSLLPCANQTSAVKVDGISFIGIKGTSATEEAIRLSCSDSYPCEGIYLEDIHLLASNSSENTTAFCWKARGSSWGLVYPPSCFACSENIIEQKILSANPHLSF